MTTTTQHADGAAALAIIEAQNAEIIDQNKALLEGQRVIIEQNRVLLENGNDVKRLACEITQNQGVIAGTRSGRLVVSSFEGRMADQ